MGACIRHGVKQFGLTALQGQNLLVLPTMEDMRGNLARSAGGRNPAGLDNHGDETPLDFLGGLTARKALCTTIRMACTSFKAESNASPFTPKPELALWAS